MRLLSWVRCGGRRGYVCRERSCPSWVWLSSWVPIVAIVVMGAGVGVGASLLAGAAAVASVGCRRGGWLSLWALLVVAGADVVGSAG